MSLSVNGNQLTAYTRKLPKREETVDAPYMVTVSGAENVDEIKRASFGDNYFCNYTIQVTLVTPNDRDQVQNLVDHAAWRETTRAAFQVTGMMFSVGNIYKVDIVPGTFLDRSEIKEGFDYNQVVLKVTTFETR